MPSVGSRSSRPSLYRRAAAWLGAIVDDEYYADTLVAALLALHVVLWTAILTLVKRAQNIHFDVAEAYAWGQQWLLGYGKHPPLSGWVIGIWFRFFPVADWATYALAMTVVSFGIWVCWRIALRVVDRRRAFLTVVMLALYPIFNFKGYKYNADLLQLATLPLLVLAYLNAFEKRNAWSGLLLGVAGAAALLTKYWALTMIGAIGITALLHPERSRFLRSPAPWVAIATFLLVLTPHLWWLKRVDFLPLKYAGDVYDDPSRIHALHSVGGYIGHNVVLLLFPIALAALAVWFVPQRGRNALRTMTFNWRHGANSGVRISQAIHIWLISIIVAIGPPLGAFAFAVWMKTDWGIPLFFLVPLALVSIPVLRIPRIALFRITGMWLVLTLLILALSPQIANRKAAQKVHTSLSYEARSELARELSDIWHKRFASRWSAVAGSVETADLMTFYSLDHPTPFTPYDAWSAGLLSTEDAMRTGFIGICDPKDWQHAACVAWMKAHVPDAEHLDMTTRRFFHGTPGPVVTWEIYIVPPKG